MNTEDVKRKCDSCKEPVSIDATKCPHCGSRQLTSRGMIIGFGILGVLGLPFSYFAIPIALSYGVPNGFLEMIGTAIVWVIGLFGPLLLLIALGGYQQRRQAIQGASSDEPEKP